LSSKFLIRSAVRDSTVFPSSFNIFSYSCAFSDNFSTCLITAPGQYMSGCNGLFFLRYQTKMHLLFCFFPPTLRIVTCRPQLATLATNRGIATAFCLAGSARFTCAGDSTIIALSDSGPLARDRYLGLSDKGLIRKNGGGVSSFCAECRGRICDRRRAGCGKGEVWIWLLDEDLALRSILLAICPRRCFFDRHDRKSAGSRRVCSDVFGLNQ